MIDVESKIHSILVDQLGVERGELRHEATIAEDLGADSLDRVELVMAMEEEFGLEIPDEEAENILTVGQAIDYVTGRLARGAARGAKV